MVLFRYSCIFLRHFCKVLTQMVSTLNVFKDFFPELTTLRHIGIFLTCFWTTADLLLYFPLDLRQKFSSHRFLKPQERPLLFLRVEECISNHAKNTDVIFDGLSFQRIRGVSLCSLRKPVKPGPPGCPGHAKGLQDLYLVA